MNKRTLTILAILLGLLFLGTLFWGLSRNSAAGELTVANTEMKSEVNELEILRDRLQSQVDSIGVAYESAAADNESLRGELSAAQEQAKRALYSMRQAQSKSKNDTDVAYQMRLQIEDLINTRAFLETNLAKLEEENSELRRENVTLRNEVNDVRTQAYNAEKKVENLQTATETMERELEVLTLGAFKATAMQVDTYRGNNNDKLTNNANRVKRIAVSFDLTDVPEEYLGVRPIYFVLTDQSGTPITSENPVRATAVVNGAKTNLLALEGRDVNVERTQRLSFVHDLDVKLAEGFYRAQIFTDLGLLGATNLQLR